MDTYAVEDNTLNAVELNLRKAEKQVATPDELEQL